jgi:hypothetical protein
LGRLGRWRDGRCPATRATLHRFHLELLFGRDLHRNGDREVLVHRFVGPKRIVGIASVYKAGIAAVTQQFLHLLDRFANHAKRFASLELMLNLDK